MALPARAQGAAAGAPQGPPPYSSADVAFMTGMIAHHAQAVLMAKWAPSHGASSGVAELCARIAVSQRDEIRSMQRWLREREQPVPEPDTLYHPATAAMAGMSMPGMGGDAGGGALMPGMLTPVQLAQLDSARGPDFDRRFLTFMIQHHQGALTMVQQLFNTPGAAQDPLIFQFASDVSSGQAAEIDRMRHMLVSLTLGISSP